MVWSMQDKAVPELVSLHKQFSPSGFTVIGLSIDDSTTSDYIEPYVKENHIPYPIGISADDKARTRRRGTARLPCRP